MPRDPLPQRRYSESFDLTFPRYTDKVYTVTLGVHANGRIGEVFINAHSKIGSDADLAARDTAILISMNLQHGASLLGLAHAMTHDAQAQPEGLAGHVLTALVEWQARHAVEALA